MATKSKKATSKVVEKLVSASVATTSVVVELDNTPHTASELETGYSLDGSGGTRPRPVTMEAIRLLRKKCGEMGVELHKHGLPFSLFKALITKAVELKRQLNAAEALEAGSDFFVKIVKNQEREQEWNFAVNDRKDESAPVEISRICGCGTEVKEPRRRSLAFKNEEAEKFVHSKYNFPDGHLLSVLNGIEREIGAFTVPPGSNGNIEIACFTCLERATAKLREGGNPKAVVPSYPYEHALKISEAVLARIERDNNRDTNAQGLASAYTRRGRGNRDSTPRSWKHEQRVDSSRKLRESEEE